MANGYVSLILHAHLPFIKHPELSECPEEKWLFEAISETYMPLIDIFKRLTDDNINFKLTMTITPSLAAMLSDNFLHERYNEYLDNMVKLTELEIERTKDTKKMNKLAVMYNEKYRNDVYLFNDVYKRDLLSQFKLYKDKGNLEIITCGATHGFLPLMTVTPESIRAQIGIGVKSFEHFFGDKPNGIWIPECAYCRELDPYIKEFGLKYFISETQTVLYSEPAPIWDSFSPISTPNGVAIFPRDFEASNQVWNSAYGYPCHPNYREYYKDIGLELDYEYIKPFISPDGTRVQTGIKYHRVTGNDNKEIYNPELAAKTAQEHADEFIQSRINQINVIADRMDKPPIIVCPFDAELFGHWWYDGPKWLEVFLRKSAKLNDTEFELITPSEYLEKHPVLQVCEPAPNSWGRWNYNNFWLNETNDYIYRQLHSASKLLTQLSDKFPNAEGELEFALNQATRELLLAQSSDWAFILTADIGAAYARNIFKEYMDRFHKICVDILNNSIDSEWLNSMYSMDNIFPFVDYRIYKSETR